MKQKRYGSFDIIMNLRQAIVAACLTIGCVSSAFADKSLRSMDISTLSVSVDPSSGTYMVIDKRMEETATGAVLFGLVGAVATSANNRAQDERRADRLREVAGTLELASRIDEALVRTLEKKDMYLPDGGADYTVRVSLKGWGLARQNKENDLMRAFLNAQVELVEPDGDVVWKKREQNIGNKTALLVEFDEEIFANEMNVLAEKLGKHISYQLIYR